MAKKKTSSQAKKKTGSPRRVKGDGTVQFFGHYYSNADFKELKSDLLPLANNYEKLAPVAPLDSYRGLTDREIDQSVRKAMRMLPEYLKVAKRGRLTQNETQEAAEIARAYLKEFSTAPRLDTQEILEATNFVGIKIENMPTNFFATVDGEVDMNIAYTSDSRPPDEKAARQLYFAVDLTLEIFGMILGIIGLGGAVKDAAKKPLLTAFGKLLKKRDFRAAFKALLEGLKANNPKAIVEFLDALEAMGNLSELLAHIFAGLDKWDYIITFAKFLAWLAAAALSGFLAFIAKLFNVFLDIAGIIVKIDHLDEATSADAALEGG